MFHLAIGEIRRGQEPVTSEDVPIPESGEESPDLGSLEPWTDDRPGGYALWEFIEPTPGPVATGGPDPVPALETGPPNGGEDHAERGADSPSPELPDPALAPVVATARDRFAEVIADGGLPSIRKIRQEIGVGYPRAVQVLEALESGA